MSEGTTMHRIAWMMIGLALAACSTPADKPTEGSARSKGAATGSAPQTSATTAEPEAKPRKLDPLPLTLVLASDVKIEKANDSGVFVGGGDPKLHVEKLDGSFDQARKDACDPLVCKVKRWVKEDKDLAVAEWTGMLSGFRAFRAVEVGGKKYVCRTVGQAGAASAEAAEAIVEPCNRLQAAGGGPLDASAAASASASPTSESANPAAGKPAAGKPAAAKPTVKPPGNVTKDDPF